MFVARMTQVQTAQPKYRSILLLASALTADEITFWKWQEDTVYSRVVFGSVQELSLERGQVTLSMTSKQSARHGNAARRKGESYRSVQEIS